MKNNTLNNLLSLVFILSIHSLFGQDYYDLSKKYFQDKTPEHVNYLKKAFRDNNAEQSLIDAQATAIEQDNLSRDYEINVANLSKEFNEKYTEPKDDYDCIQAISFQNDIDDLSKRISQAEIMTSLAKSSYELCTSNCYDERNNYEKQRNLYNNTINEYNEAVRLQKPYVPGCEQAQRDFNAAIEYYQNKEKDLKRGYQAKFELLGRKLDDYHNQFVAILESTPIKNVEYYDNGVKKSEGYWSFKINDYTGEYKTFHPNGQLETTTTLKNGENHGTYTVYYDTGIKKAEAEFENGKQVSEWIKYNEEGLTEVEVMAARINKMQEEIAAAEKEYIESIDLSSVEESIKANPIQTISNKMESGNVIEVTIDFSKASAVTTNIFLVNYDTYDSKERRKEFLSDYFDPTDKIKVSYLDENGKLIMKIDYNENSGTVEQYDDGRKTIGEFRDHQKIGIWKTYDENGQLIHEEDMSVGHSMSDFATDSTYEGQYKKLLEEQKESEGKN